MLKFSIFFFSMAGDRTPKASYVLTDQGLEKLNYLLKKYFSDNKKIFHQHLQDHKFVDRNTSSRIRQRKGGVNQDTLERLFELLVNKCKEKYREKSSEVQFDNYFLEDCDYRECSRDLSSRNSSKPIVRDSRIKEITNALKELNYDKQKSSFKEFINEISPAQYTGTFLIHGKHGYGQRWLVNQLCYLVDYDLITALCHPINLAIKHRNIERLWEDLSHKVGSSSKNPQDVVSAIYNHWQTQPILLCFNDVDKVGAKEMKYFIETFWLCFNNKIQEHCNRKSNDNSQPLLLFLIDNFGNQKFTNNFPDFIKIDDREQKYIVKIEELKLFSQEEITTWMKANKTFFSNRLISSNITEIIKDIIKYNDEGTPIQAMKQICSYFDLDWDMDIEGKLKL